MTGSFVMVWGMALATLAVSSAKGDTFIFHDLIDKVTLGHIGQFDTVIGSCAEAERFCDFYISPKDVVFTSPTALFLDASEPNSAILSDAVLALVQDQTTYLIAFQSDPLPRGGNCGPSQCIPETGGVQTAFHLVWKDENGITVRADTIQFESDVAEPSDTPEPSHLVFVLLGFGMVGVILRRCLTTT